MNQVSKSPRAQSNIRMQDVADKAGVHVTTVSLALRNSPQLPAHTRQRIQKLAEKMGYRVNPLLAALVQQRRTARSGKFQGVLAFATRSLPGQRVLDENPYARRMYRAACQHAEELGFRLEAFEARSFASDARLNKALHSRGICGVFLPPSDLPGGGPILLDWEHFAVVTFSTNLINPPMDRVDTDHFGAAAMAVRTVWSRGYRRPGLCLLAKCDKDSQGRWRGGYLAANMGEYCHIKVLPPLVADAESFPDRFQKWLQRYSPDVLIANSVTLNWIEKLPREDSSRDMSHMPLVDLNISERKSPRSGLFVCVEESSRRAIDHIVNRLYRNQLGLPENPEIVLTPPVWHEGTTLPPIASGAG